MSSRLHNRLQACELAGLAVALLPYSFYRDMVLYFTILHVEEDVYLSCRMLFQARSEPSIFRAAEKTHAGVSWQYVHLCKSLHYLLAIPALARQNGWSSQCHRYASK